MKKKNRKLIILIFFLILIIFYSVSPLSNIKEVMLINNGEPNQNLNNDIFKLDDKNFWFYNTKNLSNELMRTGLLDEVKISKEFYCKLRIELKWKKPTVALRTGSNAFAVLDKMGYVLSIQDEQPSIGIIEGIVVKYARLGEPIVSENNALTTNAVNLYFIFAENADLFEGGAVKPNIKVDNKEIINVISDKYYFNFGDGSDYEEKFSKAVAIYNDLQKKQVTTGIINVSRKNHYVYETWK